MTIAGGSGSAMMRVVASMPSMFGIRTSIRRTCGRCSRTSARASTPSAASPTCAMSGWLSMSIARPLRNIA